MFPGISYQQCLTNARFICCKKSDSLSKRAEFDHSQLTGKPSSITLCSDGKALLITTLTFDFLPLTSRLNLHTQLAPSGDQPLSQSLERTSH